MFLCEHDEITKAVNSKYNVIPIVLCGGVRTEINKINDGHACKVAALETQINKRKGRTNKRKFGRVGHATKQGASKINIEAQPQGQATPPLQRKKETQSRAMGNQIKWEEARLKEREAQIMLQAEASVHDDYGFCLISCPLFVRTLITCLVTHLLTLTFLLRQVSPFMAQPPVSHFPHRLKLSCDYPTRLFSLVRLQPRGNLGWKMLNTSNGIKIGKSFLLVIATRIS